VIGEPPSSRHVIVRIVARLAPVRSQLNGYSAVRTRPSTALGGIRDQLVNDQSDRSGLHRSEHDIWALINVSASVVTGRKLMTDEVGKAHRGPAA
jgi:hypothetical protein